MAYTWCEYETDSGALVLVRVGPAALSDAGRGWLPTDNPALPQLARGWLTRKVYGFLENGNRRTAAVASTSADLWTGAQTFFWVLQQDGQLHEALVTGKVAERALTVR